MVAPVKIIPKAPPLAERGRMLFVSDVADAENLSPSAIENFGGWTPGSPIPAKVYRERGNRVGRREARGARAALRGEEHVA